MTLDELRGLEWKASELEKLTEQELLALVTPILHITRPELAEKPVSTATKRLVRKLTPEQQAKAKRLERAKHLAEQFEIDLFGD